MKKKEVEQLVLKSMSIGIAAMMAMMSVPMTAYADELPGGTDVDVEIKESETDAETNAQDAVKATQDAATEIKEITSTIDTIVAADTEKTEDVKTKYPDQVLDAHEEISEANDDLKKEVAPAAQADTNVTPATDIEASVAQVAQDIQNISDTYDAAAVAAADANKAVTEKKFKDSEGQAVDLNAYLQDLDAQVEAAKVVIKNTTEVDDADAKAAFALIEKNKKAARDAYDAAKDELEKAEAAYNAAVAQLQGSKDVDTTLFQTCTADIQKAQDDLADAEEKLGALEESIEDAMAEGKVASKEKKFLEDQKAAGNDWSQKLAKYNSDNALMEYLSAKPKYEEAATAYGATNIANSLNSTNFSEYPQIDKLFKNIVEGYYVSNVLAPGATNVHLLNPKNEFENDSERPNNDIFVIYLGKNKKDSEYNYAYVSYELNGKTIYTRLNYIRNSSKDENGNAVYSVDIFEKTGEDNSNPNCVLNLNNESFRNWVEENKDAEYSNSNKRDALAQSLASATKSYNDAVGLMNLYNGDYNSEKSLEEVKAERQISKKASSEAHEVYKTATKAVIPVWVKYDNLLKNGDKDADEIVSLFTKYQNENTKDPNYKTDKAAYDSAVYKITTGSTIHPLIDDSAEYYEANAKTLEDLINTTAVDTSETATKTGKIVDAKENIKTASNKLDNVKTAVTELKEDVDAGLAFLKNAVSNAKNILADAQSKLNNITKNDVAHTFVRLDSIEQRENGSTEYSSKEYTNNVGSLLIEHYSDPNKYKVYADEKNDNKIVSAINSKGEFERQEDALAEYFDGVENGTSLEAISDYYVGTESVQAALYEDANNRLATSIAAQKEAIEEGLTEEQLAAGHWVIRTADGTIVSEEELTDAFVAEAYVHWYVLKGRYQEPHHIDGVLVSPGIEFTIEFVIPTVEPTPGPNVPTDEPTPSGEVIVSETVTIPATEVTGYTYVAPTPAPAEVLGVTRAPETEAAVEAAAPQGEVLGARRDGNEAVLGARRGAETGDASNAGLFATLFGASSVLGAAYISLRRRKNNDAE